mmetsp:Transcript_38398/g.89272  ORF Transcript_38398/g.89272 Transcript_38398/m.89272 type:complete len:226 (-) Transcript_38398:164-841(-)
MGLRHLGPHLPGRVSVGVDRGLRSVPLPPPPPAVPEDRAPLRRGQRVPVPVVRVLPRKVLRGARRHDGQHRHAGGHRLEPGTGRRGVGRGVRDEDVRVRTVCSVFLSHGAALRMDYRGGAGEPERGGGAGAEFDAGDAGGGGDRVGRRGCGGRGGVVPSTRGAGVQWRHLVGSVCRSGRHAEENREREGRRRCGRNVWSQMAVLGFDRGSLALRWSYLSCGLSSH